jgi:D-sedoheptulose 7-phosphate isomerase
MTLSDAAGQFAGLVKGCMLSNGEGVLSPEDGMLAACGLMAGMRASGGKIYLLGNGGSAAVASHVVTDLCNGAKLRAGTLHEPSLLSCYSNDYGYEQAYALLVQRLCHPQDLLVAISSSGQSANILNAVASARNLGAGVITLSGFLPDNPLRQLGDINFWLDSSDYGAVEVGHLFILHHLAGRLSCAREH